MIELKNNHLSAKVLPFGATLASICATGHADSLTLGFSDPVDFQRIPMVAGAIVGPLANRLANGQARIEGRFYQMPRNENGRASLHSGPEGLHRRNWLPVEQSGDTVTLQCVLTHSECGLPGFRTIAATYWLEDNVLCLRMTAISDRETIMNLAHHPYWVTDSRARLRVSADHFLPVDDYKLPTGRQALVENTVFDLRQPRPVPPMLDHNYILSDAPTETPRRVAILEMPHYQLRLETTAPGLQVYAGANLPNLGTERSTGWPIAPLSGVALEPQFWPDAPSHSSFPSVRLPAHTQWSQLTRYVIEV